MGHCKDCKFWGGREPHVADHEQGACGRIPHGSANGGVPDGELAVTWDAEMYESGLLTRAEFGCVLFKPVEAPGG